MRRDDLNGNGIQSCVSCPVGVASGVGTGGICPLVDRPRAAGQWIHLEGAPADTIWFVKRGIVVLSRSRRGDAAGERVHALRGPGSFLGLEALVRSTYLDGAQALTDVKVCGVSRTAFDSWLGAPGTPARTALELTISSGTTDAPRGASADGNAVRRVARWLLELPGSEPPAIPRRVTANMLGMVPETLSRALARLSSMGAIIAMRHSLKIRDRVALARAAGLSADDS